jgi:hypothetical protein
MQKLLMAVSPIPRTPGQLPLFARTQRNPHWTDLPLDVQRKILRLMAQLLMNHRGIAADAGTEEEISGE